LLPGALKRSAGVEGCSAIEAGILFRSVSVLKIVVDLQVFFPVFTSCFEAVEVVLLGPEAVEVRRRQSPHAFKWLTRRKRELYVSGLHLDSDQKEVDKPAMGLEVSVSVS
jgi:hypothetical protein